MQREPASIAVPLCQTFSRREQTLPALSITFFSLPMALTARSIGAILVAILGPLLYLSHDRVTFPIPEAVTPVLPQIHRLQQYIRIRTDHPEPAYDQAVHFLNYTISTLLPNATTTVHYFVSNKPLLLVTLRGSRPNLPSILLNSHTDVVPAEPEKWRMHPFAARAAVAQGQLRIYGRGTQDMKSVGLQYIEALAELTASGWTPTRTIHVSFVPDEEIGGLDGMGRFVKSPVFANLNVGVVLDEGLPNPNPLFNVYYGERQTWWLIIRVKGNPGHGYTMPKHTAPSILHEIIERVLAFRREQFARLKSGLDIGEVVGVNVAFLKAGVPNEHTPGGHIMNFVPSVAEAGFDIRVPPTANKEHMEAEIERWITCGDVRCPGVSYEWVIKVDIPNTTSRDPEVNPFIKVFRDGLEKAGIVHRLRHGIFPAATDGRFIRDLGIPCFGFSPIEKTPDLLHKHNEFISVEGYMKGYRIYKDIIKEFAEYDPEAKSREEVFQQDTQAKRSSNEKEDDGAGETHGSSEKQEEDEDVSADDSEAKAEL